ncbi:rab11 family-interacting protein 3 isoform X2 [Erinaceus europaeus]|uniref:Rab11 family-interacting protein 3 isoform X2 n=1 Tax=Erinaceus europaeus TaxID=9365 RepID=A0A1S3WHU0_ERIEU|nr:rab11 family-interacting protein 3 isoform X2 [Erinaceus europaeus]
MQPGRPGDLPPGDPDPGGFDPGVSTDSRPGDPGLAGPTESRDFNPADPDPGDPTDSRPGGLSPGNPHPGDLGPGASVSPDPADLLPGDSSPDPGGVRDPDSAHVSTEPAGRGGPEPGPERLPPDTSGDERDAGGPAPDPRPGASPLLRGRGLDSDLDGDLLPHFGADPAAGLGPHPDPYRDLDAHIGGFHLHPRLDPNRSPDPDPHLDLDPDLGLDSDLDLGLDADLGPEPDLDPDRPLPELGPLLSWTRDPEDCVPEGRCPRRLRLGFPAYHPSCSEGQPAPEGAPEAPSQLYPLPSEPSGYAEDGPRLRAVFDALDADGDGLVRTEDFVQFATVYGAEQVKDLTRYLDPRGLGVISFKDFYHGITAIRNGDSHQLCGISPAPEEEPPACPDEFEDFVTYEATEVTDSAYMGSESTYSECETFTDEDTSTLVHPEGDADSAGGSALPSECLDPMEELGHGALLLLPGRSHLHSQAVVTVIGGEEHFEDYGEAGDAELSPDTLCIGEQGCGDPAFLTPSPTKRLSSKKVARHLLQSGALTMEALQDPPEDVVEGLEEDISDKVVFLEKRVSELEKDTAATGEQHSRLRQENLQLVHRANALEEQLKEQELRACDMLLEETRRQKEVLCRMEREKSIEIETLQARLQQLDEENSELRSCTPCLKASIQRLEEEKQKLLDEIEELSLRLGEEQENKRRLGDRLSQERHQFQRDKEATQELIEDLRRQLEHLQLFKLEAEQRRGRSSSAGLQEYHSRTRESELEQEVRRLKQDNRSLKEQNDELNGQIINLSIQGAKNLFSTAFSESLAAEISSVSRDELMEAIQKQEEINFRLQDYIDRIIVAIMETNPSILEVK